MVSFTVKVGGAANTEWTMPIAILSCGQYYKQFMSIIYDSRDILAVQLLLLQIYLSGKLRSSQPL